MTDTALLALEGVSVSFARGRIVALEDISVTAGAGVVGLVGANGAGKTTLLRAVAGALAPTRGSLRMAGIDAQQYRQTHGIGFIPAHPRFPSYLSVAQFLDGLRLASGSPGPTAAEEGIAEEFGLARIAGRRLETLSLGQCRRVEVAAALIGDPDLILFDEPTNGLDPIAMSQLRAGILAARRPGRCILVSSHHLDELQRLADRVLFLRAGRLVGDHGAAELAADGASLETRFLSMERGLDA